MPDPLIIESPLSQEVVVEGEILKIDIYRLQADEKWTLEVVDEQSTSTVWEDPFDTEEAALAEALSAIKEEGVSAFKVNTLH